MKNNKIRTRNKKDGQSKNNKPYPQIIILSAMLLLLLTQIKNVLRILIQRECLNNLHRYMSCYGNQSLHEWQLPMKAIRPVQRMLYCSKK